MVLDPVVDPSVKSVNFYLLYFRQKRHKKDHIDNSKFPPAIFDGDLQSSQFIFQNGVKDH